ncbi:HSCB C-terminal oligomerization domain-containing protein [Entophlyctis helioformis]|nr:HSCB C-terminal oligomerization domain-containing protein [Entophlyctis helioformis]
MRRAAAATIQQAAAIQQATASGRVQQHQRHHRTLLSASAASLVPMRFKSTTPANGTAHSHTHSHTDTQSAVRSECWRCGSHIPGPSAFFCKNTSCAVILPPSLPSPNYFALMLPSAFPPSSTPSAPSTSSAPSAGEHGDMRAPIDHKALPRILASGYDLDTADLRASFLRLQQQLHPDNFGTKSSEERLNSEQQSTLVNKAYQVLRDPLTRAQYMLQLAGVHIDETTSVANREFLMDVMEIQESVEEAGQADLAALKRANDDSIKEAERRISDAFKQGNLQAAKDATVELKYWRNIHSMIVEKMT